MWNQHQIFDGLKVEHPTKGVAQVVATDTGYFNVLGVADRFVHGAERDEEEVAELLNRQGFTPV